MKNTPILTKEIKKKYKFKKVNNKKKPLRNIPFNLINMFTMDGKIKIKNWYIDDTYLSKKPKIYTEKQIIFFIKKIENRKTKYYGRTDLALYKALEKYSINGKRVVIMGSNCPWYESICLYHKGECTIVDYNKIISKDPRLKTMTVSEYDKNPIKFDVGISISSFEHDGLGRYGDPIDPEGDLKAMNKMKTIIKKNGLLFLSVPTGKDLLVWNAHRIYGKIRFPLLIKGWKLLETFEVKENWFKKKCRGIFNKIWGHMHGPQPVFVLKNI